MRVVLDTNILVSGLMLPESVPGKIVAAWRGAQFELVLSEPMLDGIGGGLSYPGVPARATLVAAGADCRVRGDGDLLALWDRYPVLPPADFARRI